MCGIAGELRLVPGERASAERVRAMCDVMVHRGPDSFGEFTDGEVGARHAAPLRSSTSPADCSRSATRTARVQVVCNGEIYNSPALCRRSSRRAGTGSRTRSDVEVIAHLYEE